MIDDVVAGNVQHERAEASCEMVARSTKGPLFLVELRYLE
jgi:hypothetical protein